jgi:hypothetical protein
MRKTTVNFPDDVFALMERAAASGVRPGGTSSVKPWCWRCAVAAGEVTDDIRAGAVAPREAEKR